MSVNSVQQFLNVRDSHLRVVSGNVHADQMVIGGITEMREEFHRNHKTHYNCYKLLGLDIMLDSTMCFRRL